MKRYLIAALFAVGIIMLYKFYPINFFNINLSKRINDKLFNELRSAPVPDTSIVILNSGNLSGPELKIKLDTLLKFHPRLIAINLCDVDRAGTLLEDAYANNQKVVLGTCNGMQGSLSRQVYEDNIVTHFKTDSRDYLEFRIADTGNLLRERSNKLERINYYGSFTIFHHINLADLENTLPGLFENKLLLIGYCGEYVNVLPYYMDDSENEGLRDYKSSRITPMNKYYGHDDLLPDMYDIQISANIIRMINERNFITDIGPVTRVGFILFCTMLLVLLITVIRTRWLFLNLIIYFVCYSLIIMGATLLIVVGFDNGYYLEIPELSVVLTMIGIFTILYNLVAQKKSVREGI